MAFVNKSQSLVSHKLSAMLQILSNAFIVKQMSTMNIKEKREII